MSAPPLRYNPAELHALAHTLETEKSAPRRLLGRHLRDIADAVSEIAEVERGYSSDEEEQACIRKVFKV